MKKSKHKNTGKKHNKKHNEKISKALKGRIPWNKGVGVEDPRIRQMVKTRHMNKALRELVLTANGLPEEE